MSLDTPNFFCDKTNAELSEYIENSHRYSPEMVRLAMLEQNKRLNEGQSPESTETEASTELAADTEASDTEYVIDDSDLPRLYPKLTIWAFTIIFGTLAGSILMAVNIKNSKVSKSFWPVLLFGIVFYSIQIWSSFSGFLNMGESPVPINMFSIVGGAVLHFGYWGNIFGDDFSYRNKPAWIPLIICVLSYMILVSIFYHYIAYIDTHYH